MHNLSWLMVGVGVLVLPLAIAAQPKKTAMLSCSPSVLTDASTLTLRFKLPHPAELGISSPDGTFFFLALPDEKVYVDKESFSKLSRLDLPVATAKVRPWIYGRDADERIFQKPGVYQVELSDNLETDVPVTVYQCKVTFRPRTRP
jgi:hypothetical protein